MLVLSAMLATAPAAQAQEPPDGYREIIAAAVEEFAEGRWAEAAAIFERAHALFPNARTLRGMGMCAFEMRQYPEAIRFLDEALRESRRELTSAQRDETQELLGRARGFVGSFRLLTEPPGADLRIDGEVPRRGPEGHVMLGGGEHVLTVSASGYLPLGRRLLVGGGEDETLRLVLQRAGLGGPPDPAIALFVAGAATLLIEPFAIGWWVDREAQATSCANPPPGFTCDNAGSLSEQRDAAMATTIVAGVGALALAAVGVILWLVSSPDDAPPQVACGAHGVGLGCRF